MKQVLINLRSWIVGLTPGPVGYTIGGALAIFAIAQILTEWQPGFRPFTTYGEVYVDSPEVYTRQRLVNDRYAQDHWLRTKLEGLNDGFQPLAARRSSNNSVFVRAQTASEQSKDGDGSDSAQVSVAAEVEGLSQLMSMHAIEVEASVRTALRQAILENQLDDRHDLSGNSIYGFKFDTTVISGTNTRRRAFVRIKTKVAGPRDRAGPDRVLTFDDYLLYPNSGDPNLSPVLSSAYKDYGALYTDWLQDVEQRLDRYAQTLVNVRGLRAPTEDELALRRRIDDEVKRRQGNLIVSQAKGAAQPAEDVISPRFAAADSTDPIGLESAMSERLLDLLKTQSEERITPDGRKEKVCWVAVEDYTFTRSSQEAELLWNVLETVLAISKTDIDKAQWKDAQGVYSLTQAGVTAGADSEDWSEAKKSNSLDPNEQVGTVELSLEPPWGEFYKIKASINDACNWEFDVEPVMDNFVILREPPAGAVVPPLPKETAKANGTALAPSKANGTALGPPKAKYFPLFGLEAPAVDCEAGTEGGAASCPRTHSYTVVSKYYGELGSFQEFEEKKPKYPIGSLPDAYFDALIRQLDEKCAATNVPDHQTCEIGVYFQTGLLSLIRHLIDQDSYAYAVLPKNEVSGLISDQVNTGFVDVLMRSANVAVSASDAVSESRTLSAVVGFSDSSASENGSIDFGWLFDPRVAGGSLQKSQMALISVPAWDDEIEFVVKSGWIDRHGREIERLTQDFEIAVALPPDFEAFETIIFGRGNDTRRQPIVHMDLLPENEQTVRMKGCIANSVLIPGRRLWRSTTVTLGAHEAAKITVLPNMDGIIATFPAFSDDEIDAMTDQEKIRVWTSEGMVQTGLSVNLLPCTSGARSSVVEASTSEDGDQSIPVKADAETGDQG